MIASLVKRNREYYRKRIRYILSNLDLNNSSILDLGAGELILREELKNVNYKSYIGVDSIQFQVDSEFIYSDIFDFLNENSLTHDSVFCLGVLDHLSEDDKKRLVEKLYSSFSSYLVISKANDNNLIIKLFKKKFKLPLINKELSKLYLLKLPFTHQLYKLKSESFLSKLIATEVVYIFSSKS